jgi:hypothetical protein
MRTINPNSVPNLITAAMTTNLGVRTVMTSALPWARGRKHKKA